MAKKPTYKNYNFKVESDYFVDPHSKVRNFDCTNVWITVDPQQKGYMREPKWLNKYLKSVIPSDFTLELMNWNKIDSFYNRIKHWDKYDDDNSDPNPKMIYLSTQTKLSNARIDDVIHAVINKLLTLSPLIKIKKSKSKSKTMDFSRALIYLKYGYTIKRKSWSTPNAIFIPLGKNEEDSSIEVADSQYSITNNKLILNTNTYLPAYLNVQDILANDWIVVDHSENNLPDNNN